MAFCTNINTFKDLIEGFITQYEDLLKDDTLTEEEVLETQETLEELYGYVKAIKNNDKEYIAAQGFIKDQQDFHQEVLQKTFESVLGDTIEFSYSGNSTTHTGSVLSVTPTHSGISIELIEGSKTKQYSFPLTSDGRSHKTKDSGTYITVKGLRKLLDNYSMNLEQAEQLEIVLGSKRAMDELDESYRQEGYIHGSISHMKDTLKRLHILGGEKATQEELDTYLALIDKMSPAFFENLSLYIKEEANRSEGVARASRIDITVNSEPRLAGNQQSEASIYMEEVVHSMTAAALHANTPAGNKLKRQLANFIELSRKQLKWQDLLPKESIDAVKEEAQAKFLYDYIFSGKNADYEFIAKALTVPEVANALKHVKIKEGTQNKRFLERVNEFFAAILDIIHGNMTVKQRNENVHEALVNLAFELGEINTKANRKLLEKGNYLTAVMEMLNGVDADMAAALLKVKTKLVGSLAEKELGPMPDDLYGKVKWVGEVIGLSIVNPSYTKAMGAIATAWGMKPDGAVREIIGSMFATDKVQRIAEFLAMQSGYIDKKRNNQIDLVRKNVLSKFSKNISKTDEEVLTALLADVDMASLFGKESAANKAKLSKTIYDNKTLRKLLTDDATLDRLIKDAKRTLKDLDNNHYYWHANQAVGLGIYMATHRGSPEQNLNAYNIARGIHSSHSKRPAMKVVKAIDELATLVGIKNTSKEQREQLASLMENEWEGVQHVADVVEGFKRNSTETVFKNHPTNKIKGYSREVFDDTIVMEVAPSEDEARMKAQGFIKKTTLAPRAGDTRNKPMALYITDSASRPERLRGGTRLNQIKSKGTSIKDLSYKDGEGFSTALVRERAQRDINNIQRAAMERAKKMESGEYDFTDTIYGVTAVLNDAGKVTDYRYMMDKETKKGLLKQDTRISEVMARSFGTLLDKDLSKQHNEKVLESLKQDMFDNWTEGTKGNDGLTDYTLIGPNVADPEMRKLYYMLPKEFHEFVNNTDDKTLAVRSDLHHLYFGYSHMTIANFPGLSKVTPQVLMKVIKFAEMMWMELVKIVKTNILMKMPTVLLSNIFANFMYGVMRGYDPLTLVSMQIESYRDITAYNKSVKEIQSLENDIREMGVVLEKDTITPSRKASLTSQIRIARQKQDAVKRRMETNYSHIHELVQLGLDQNVEDVTNDTDSDTNRITGFFDEQLQKTPELVRNGLDILFITKRTKFYKIANEFLEVSDLVSRDVQNRLEKKNEMKQADGIKALPTWWLEQQEGSYNPTQRLTGEERKKFLAQAKEHREYELVEDFINYTKPSSRIEEYLNKVGILMFTKYVKRIQRIIMKNTSNAPIKTAVVALAVGFLGGLPSIHEQSFLVKDWYGDSLGPGNIFPIYSPSEHFMNFITPSLLKASTYDFSI